MHRDLVEQRRLSVPKITYPSDLPITGRRQEILDTIRSHQVVVIAGETGSGKSTQIPKFCLELGRGVEAMIGHTQPRRLAARSIAARVAEEVGTSIGELVGYTVRFTDEVGARTLVKTMTDGILLAELQRDPDLRRYDTIIIDEAHERTLNIDFLLGYLLRLVDRRRDLKVIITSATIDTEKFSNHFGGAPVIEVSGRTYPVDVRYQPLGDPDKPETPTLDVAEGIERAARILLRETPGDILCFLPGEREIRETQDHLSKTMGDVEILPLFGQLSPAEQQRIFQRHDRRRIILSTNVAETSLTVPGIHAVIDTGTARISRFNRRTKVQRLPIEDISQASADQRAGRCGRLGPGVCIRLFDESDFSDRPEFTEPEVQRTNLASVVLRMASLGLGDAESFPFIDPPDARAIRDGITLLEELDAVDPGQAGTDGWLTPLGLQLASIPIDPKLGRMLLEADDHGCCTEVAIIVAGLSIQDPRIRPTGVGSGAASERAAQLHARYTDDSSDFLSWLLLWAHVKVERNERSGNGFKKMCRDEYLHFLRIREWEEVHRQLRQIAKALGLRFNDNPAHPDAVHQALLSGLLAHVGFFDSEAKQYRGTRGARFVLAGGSALKQRTPAWVMAAELVETNQLRARTVAPINPQWLERSASHLLRWEHSDPWWNAERGAAVCDERASLYGLPVVPNRQINLQRVDPDLARTLFIRHALVLGEWEHRYRFAARNEHVLAEIEGLGARLRRDIAIDEHVLETAFDHRLPSNVVSARHFDRWWTRYRQSQPDALDLSIDELLKGFDIDGLDACPEQWPWDDRSFRVDYRFDPAAPDDGITIEIPLQVVSRVDPAPFAWLIPSFRRELVLELLRTLPRQARRLLMPIPEAASEILAELLPTEPPLLDQLVTAVQRRGIGVTARDFDSSALAPHLRPHFRVVDNGGGALAEDDDLEVLKRHFVEEARKLLDRGGHELEATGAITWVFDRIPRTISTEGLGQIVTSYPALVDEGETVGVRLFATTEEQADQMWLGTRRLLSLARPALGRVLRPLLTAEVKDAIVRSPYDGPQAWFEDCLVAALDQVMVECGGPAWNGKRYAELVDQMNRVLCDHVSTIARTAANLLEISAELTQRVAALDNDLLAAAVADIADQQSQLVYDGFIATIGFERLTDVERYLRGLLYRVERLPDTIAKDRDRMRSVRLVEAEHAALIDERGTTPELEELAWDLQELRMSVFAQPIGAARPVSVKRIRNALEQTRRG
jgi:ATP-dependent helicase HrpA